MNSAITGTPRGVLQLNGVDIYYDDHGNGRQSVLLIHGHPFNRTMWRPQREWLSQGYRVIVPDLRGYGHSALSRDSHETRLETFAADNLALMDALGIERFSLGGLSMGGQIVLEMHRQAPDRIQRLLLADTFAGPDTPDIKRLRLATADRLEREGMSAFSTEVLTRMITSENAQQLPHVAAHVMEMMTTTPPAGAAAALRGRARRRDYLPLLKQIRVPASIVVGRDDTYTPLAMAQQLVNGIPHSRLWIIEGAGHMPNLERPDAFNAALAAWLEDTCVDRRSTGVE